jgi:hypothetical protein
MSARALIRTCLCTVVVMGYLSLMWKARDLQKEYIVRLILDGHSG